MNEPKRVKLSPEFQKGLRDLMEDSGVSQVALSVAAGVKRHWINQALLTQRALKVDRALVINVKKALLNLLTMQDQRNHLIALYDAYLPEREMAANIVPPLGQTWTNLTGMDFARDFYSLMKEEELNDEQMREVVSFLEAVVLRRIIK